MTPRLKRLLVSLVLTVCCALSLGCSREPDPWSGQWRGENGATVRFDGSGKVTYSSRISGSSGDYKRVGSDKVEYEFTEKMSGATRFPSPQKGSLTLSETKKSFEMGGIRYRREE